ncbi:tetratricopeptide repeat protein [Haliea sp. E17]|uniref:tetratricopeptide repeat protein n=1 Tax=Haliea sp. E17 TaxID=3401576 RepID=UPI003AAC5655
MSFEELLSKARRLQKKGNIAEALQLYQQILQRDPGNKKARKAIRLLQQTASRPDPSRLQADFQQLISQYQSGDQENALALATELAQRYPDQPLPLNLIGAILSSRGDYQAALPNFARALQLEPRYGDALANLADTLGKLDRYEEAASIYRQYLGLVGESAEGLITLGGFLRNTQQRPAAMECYQRALTLAPASAEARIKIADARSQSQRFEEALTWYREALEYDAASQAALLGAGRCLLQLGRRDEAVDALQLCLDINPGNGEASHLLNAAREIDSEAAPESYVKGLFDGYAPTFEQHLTGALAYRGPEQLLELLDETLPGAAPFSHMADLGCGTGKGGAVFGDRCEQITGIDLSTRMLDKAREKGCYNQLLNGDIAAVLNSGATRYSLFLCADSVIYIGELAALGDAIAGSAAPGAIVCLTTEDIAGSGFKLQPTGRFAHSRQYVESTLAQRGFELLAFREAPLRKERTGWIGGGFYIFRFAA